MEADFSEIIKVAKQATEPHTLKRGALVTTLNEHGGLNVQDLEKYGDAPLRPRGTVTTYDVPSFLDYFGAHAAASSQIYVDADPRNPVIIGVLNPHERSAEQAAAGWHDHTVNLTFRQTPQSAIWTGANKNMMAQVDFAEFVQDNLKDFIEAPKCKRGPTPTEMMALVESLEGARDVKWKSAERLSDGNRQFMIEETTVAKAGKNGAVKVPEHFYIGIPLYDCTDKRYEVHANFRWRLNAGGLTMGYSLERWSDVVALAVSDVVDAIKKGGQGMAGKIIYGRPISDLR